MTQTNNPLISIIVPIYNVETYLERCILSLIRQSYNNLEIILVDDGSPDNCAKICKQFAVRDQRIKFIHQDNQGVTSARHNGFKISSGDYITFVDGDDYLPCEAINIFVQEIEQNLDIIIGNSDRNHLIAGYMSNADYRKFCIIGGKVPFAIWGHLYRRTLFNDEVFDIRRDIKKGEDMIMNIRLAFRTKNKIKIIPQIIYYYTYNPDSVMQTFTLSLDYEYIFQKYLKQSIPIEFFNQYQDCYIKSRIRSLFEYICIHPSSKNWKGHPFYKKLLQDLRDTQYKDLKCSEKIIIFSPSDYLRILVLHIFSIKNKLTSYLRNIIN